MKNVDARKNRITCKQVSISCVVPAYNEHENIKPFVQALSAKLSDVTENYEIIVIDDGSHDETSAVVKDLIGPYHVKLLTLSRNFGKEHALTAGLQNCRGEVAILMDCDFQHPIELIDIFLEKWSEGFDMVYGVRENRGNESLLKRTLTKVFYNLMIRMTKTNMPPNAGDFRLLDRKVMDALNGLHECGRFMKGLYAWVGFSATGVPFTAPDRIAGQSGWRFGKLAELAVTGITAFSDVPLRVWGLMGLIISATAFAYGIIIILDTILYGVDVPGYATTIVAIMFFGGIQLLSIGILGEYIGRIFQEVKKRPNFIVAERVGFDN